MSAIDEGRDFAEEHPHVVVRRHEESSKLVSYAPPVDRSMKRGARARQTPAAACASERRFPIQLGFITMSRVRNTSTVGRLSINEARQQRRASPVNGLRLLSTNEVSCVGGPPRRQLEVGQACEATVRATLSEHRLDPAPVNRLGTARPSVRDS